MNIKLEGEMKILMGDPHAPHGYCGWPTVARLKNGTIVVGASCNRVEHVCPFGKATVIFSEDNGETYSDPVVIIDTVLDDRDVGLTAFGESGLIVTSFNNENEFQRENMPQTQECFDCVNAVTPEAEAEVLGPTMRISYDSGKTFGKLYRPPVSSPHGPTVLSDGTILWVGRVLGSHNQIEAHKINPENGESEFVGSIDVAPYDYLDFYEPHAVQLPGGRIVCQMRVQNSDESIFTMYQSVSDDLGKTWSEVKQVVSDTSGAPPHLFVHSSGVLISAFSRRTMPCGIRFVMSTDGGETWSEEFSLYENYETDDLGYPATTELPDGTLLTVFYARDNEEVHALIRQQKWRIENL